jgi:O-antigen/teichoic acid export membrane protein
MNTLLRRSLALGGIEALMRIPLVLATGYLARRLGTADYGQWTVVLAFHSIVLSFASLGLSSAVSRYAASATPAVALGMLLFSLASCLVTLGALAILILSFRFGFADLLGLPSTAAVLIGGGLFLVLAQLAESLFDAFFKARELIVRQAVFQFLRTVVDVGAIVVIFSQVSPDGQEEHIRAILAYVGIAACAKAILYPCLLLRLAPRTTMPDADKRRHMLQIGLPLIPAAIFLALRYQQDRLLLGQFLDHETLGVYGLAAALAAYLHFIGNVAYAMLLPRLSRFYDQGLQGEVATLMDRSQRLFLDLMVPVLVCLALLGNEFIEFLAGRSFAAAAPILLLLGLGVAIDRLFGPYAFVFYLARRSTWLMWLNAVYCVTMAVGVVVGLHLAGALGAAFGVVAATILNNLLCFSVSRLFMQLMPTLTLWRAIALAIAAIVVAGIMANYLNLLARALFSLLAVFYAMYAVTKLRHDEVPMHKAA